MTPRKLNRRETAVCFIAALENRGARFILRPDDTFRLSLDESDVASHAEASDLAHLAFDLRDEIRAVLQSQRTHH